MSLLLGCIADDFTGATDLANTLVKQGMRTVQVIGIPDDNTNVGDAQAVVVALKSRTNLASEAVDWSIRSLRWLRKQGAQQFFFKYCSTFDSTDKGNIGPVADAMLKELDSDFTVACPAFPANRRTVYKGNLFVDNVPLADSGMRDHPLTPMRDSNLVRVLGQQTSGKVSLIGHDTVRQGASAIADACEGFRAQAYRYAIVDAVHDKDLINIGKACTQMKLITGGSGIALGLPGNFRDAGLIGDWSPASLPKFSGRKIVLAGSCSIASRKQLAAVANIWPQYILDPLAIADNHDITGKVLSWAQQQDPNLPLVISSSADPDTLEKIQIRLGQQNAAELIEQAFGSIASGLVEQGANQLIVAGGETSGSVISALGIDSLQIGPEIDPGVPWCETIGSSNLAVALKSGNFGSEHFFEKAFDMLA